MLYIYSKSKIHLRQWYLVYLCLFLSFIICMTGLFSGHIVQGCATPICNSIRNLEWETLSAGMLGLAGGTLAYAAATHTERTREIKATDAFVARAIPVIRQAILNFKNAQNLSPKTPNEALNLLQKCAAIVTTSFPEPSENVSANVIENYQSVQNMIRIRSTPIRQFPNEEEALRWYVMGLKDSTDILQKLITFLNKNRFELNRK